MTVNLKDFYYADKHSAGTKMPIMLPCGEDSGEWLRVLGPDCNTAITVSRGYTAAVRAVDDELAPLDKECEASGNFAKYNDKRGYLLETLNDQLAADLVIEWSFEDEFSKDAVLELLKQYRGLSMAVAKHFAESRVELSAK